MNEYATLAELKKTLTLVGDNFADEDLQLALSAASRGVDNFTGRRFWADTNDTDRYYSPEHPGLVAIDDLVELTAVGVDTGSGTFEPWTENDQFVLEPLNAPADGWPWIALRPRAGHRLPTLPRSLKLTGKFGWEAVPDPIKEATVVLASKLMRRAREAPFGVVTVGIDEGAAMRIARTDPDVAFLARPYSRDGAVIA